MKSQPKPDYTSSDNVQTPPEVAKLIVRHFLCPIYNDDRHFKHGTRFLDPCRGDGSFYNAAMPLCGTARMAWCEINEGRDFYEYSGKVDWIITNPPWSLLKAAKGRISFMEKAFRVADNVVFLLTLNHALGSKARYRLMDQYGFGIREVVLLDTPPEPWPASGFQIGAVHWQRGRTGMVQFVDLREQQ